MKASTRPPIPLPARTRAEVELHLEEAARYWRSRPDLHAKYPDPLGAEYWYWAQWSVASRWPGYETGSFATPPPALISRVVGEMTALDFHRSGLVDWRRIHLSLERAGFRAEGGGSQTILEFGCGCGRILRFFARSIRSCRLAGVDVDTEAIAWCVENLRFADFETIRPAPPLPFRDASFDAIYAFSVFTHLPERAHLAWLRELARVARPGGAVVLTVQGRHVLALAASGARPETMPGVADRAEAAARAEREGFFFAPFRSLDAVGARAREHFSDWDLDAYGSAFVLEPYVRRRWAEIFDVVEFAPSPDGWQDVVTLRAR